jgi:hypothetical protein
MKPPWTMLIKIHSKKINKILEFKNKGKKERNGTGVAGAGDIAQWSICLSHIKP